MAAGFSFSGPASERISLLSSSRVARLLDVSLVRAREIMRELPGSVMLPGGDLRCRVQELERWLDQRPVEVRATLSRDRDGKEANGNEAE
jgi:hypothetical protein